MKMVVFNLSRMMSLIGQMILLFIMFLITFDVFGRYLFNKPIKGTFELTELGLALIVFFSLAITHWHKEHVDIDFIVDKLSGKTILIIDSIINALIAVMAFLSAWKLIDYSERIRLSNTVTGDLKLPVSIFIIFGAIGMLSLGLVALVRMVGLIKRRVTNDT